MTDPQEIESPSSKTDYRLTRVEREVAELRAKIESGQGAMLQAVAGVQTQLASFQIGLQQDLNNRFVSQREAEEKWREFRASIEVINRRLDAYDVRNIQKLEDERKEAEANRSAEGERSFRATLALITAAASAFITVGLHFVHIPGGT